MVYPIYEPIIIGLRPLGFKIKSLLEDVSSRVSNVFDDLIRLKMKKPHVRVIGLQRNIRHLVEYGLNELTSMILSTISRFRIKPLKTHKNFSDLRRKNSFVL